MIKYQRELFYKTSATLLFSPILCIYDVFTNILNKTTINLSIYAWKRSVIPPNPEEVANIDTTCPFFLSSSGENICKASIEVGGDPRRRLLLLTTDKVMEKGVRLAQRGVMDATFDVSFFYPRPSPSLLKQPIQ